MFGRAKQGSLAYVAIGSNVNPLRHVPDAIEQLAAHAPLTGISSFYKTPAINRPEQEHFVNGVVRLFTPLPPLEFKHQVLRVIEANLGRQRGDDPYDPRTMDLDLLLHGNTVSDKPGLDLPDPDIGKRPFLAACLYELDPALKLPGSGRLVRDLPRDVSDLPRLNALTVTLRERWLSPG